MRFSKHWFKDENMLDGVKKEEGNCRVPYAEIFLTHFLGERELVLGE